MFWYRSSPRPLAAGNIFAEAPISGSVWTNDPPLDVSGMTLVKLNPLGRLTQLIAVPSQVEKPTGTASPPDWTPLFSAAGLDPSKWPSTQPTWTSPVDSDSRAAWTGSLAERPNIPMRIEAAAYRGKPVYFELIGPWTRPSRMEPYHETAGERVFLGSSIILFLAVLVGSAILARRNLRLGRGDRRGAFRVAAFVFVAWTAAWFFGAHHVPSFAEFRSSSNSWSGGCGWSGFMWLLYIALEPYVRRRWPATLVSWSRLLGETFGIRSWGVMSLSVVFCVRPRPFLDAFCGLFPPGSAILRPSQWRVHDRQFLGARTIIADFGNRSDRVSLFIPLTLYLSCSFSGPCCARSGRRRSHAFSSSRCSSHWGARMFP